MEEVYTKRIMSALIFIGLLILSYFVLEPIILSIAAGFFLAFIFAPLYGFLYKKSKMPNLSALLICLFLLAILIIPIWLFMPTIIKQSFTIYQSVQKLDLVKLLKDISPSVFASDQFTQDVGTIAQSFINNSLNSFLNSLASIVLNFPTLMLQFLVVIFTMFYVLRDGDLLVAYLESLLPFSDDIKKKFFKSSRDITKAILYENIVVGVIQGIILGLGFFLFGVSNALVLTLLGALVGVLPVLGPMLVWVPVLIFLIIKGDNVAVIGILLVGLLSSNIDTILRPWLVSRRVKVHTTLVLIGMIGGLLFFGVLGLILGPLILSYLVIVLDIYRDKELQKSS
ncbi:AI-2E family transporter [Candidatus Pacearchaeota archaeon]|nr:AI-2E family transporter [Candidatus Pacearchaeota archaeon]